MRGNKCIRISLVVLAAAMVLPGSPARCAEPGTGDLIPDAEAGQFILVNRTRGPAAVSREDFEEVKRALPDMPGARIRVGVGYIFSYFRADEAVLLASLRHVLDLAEQTETPVLIQIDGEQWWEGRPDLWNWWDPSRPGFDPANRENVEWSGWTAEHALKIAWRNWGRQLRVLPPPNLMSPRYREACHEKMVLAIPVVLDWWKALPPEKRDLLVGVKVGWESSVGVNAWYYPNGNALLDQPADKDPTSGLTGEAPPARGVAMIGYAARWRCLGVVERRGESSSTRTDQFCRAAAPLHRQSRGGRQEGLRDRNVLYQIRSFNRYRQSFVVSIANDYYPVLHPAVRASLLC